MALTYTHAAKIRAITSSVPARKFDNLVDATQFDRAEVEKVVRMAGVKSRYMADDSVCCSDLCLTAAKDVMKTTGWAPESIDASTPTAGSSAISPG